MVLAASVRLAKPLPPPVTIQMLSSDMQGGEIQPSKPRFRQGGKAGYTTEGERERRDGKRQRRRGGCALAVESPVADRLVELLSLSLCLPPSLNTEPCIALQKMRAWRIPHIFLSLSSYFSLTSALSANPIPLSLSPSQPRSPSPPEMLPLLSNAEQMQCILRNVRLQSTRTFITWVRRHGVLIYQIWFESYFQI